VDTISAVGLRVKLSGTRFWSVQTRRPLFFWEEVCRQVQCKWRASKSIVEPVVGMSIRIVERNSLLNLAFSDRAAAKTVWHLAIEISPKTTIKK
jgi:hypothetical protein